MRRTLQTTEQSLGWLMERGVPAVVRAEFQETTIKPCDVGSPISQISQEWPQFDWSEIDPVYPSKEGFYEYSQEALTKRGIAARRWLRDRPEKAIAVVSHAGFLRVGLCQKKFDNADFRVFDFEEGEEHGKFGPQLVEWEMTDSRGGGLGKSPKGAFGWEINGFKTMPNKTPECTEPRSEEGA
ncbi:MAG: hypothetical protein M1834_007233 [Cirrosporium novae-zelandiae]|nr:MAG: hypothetical protein M1834_007233 [Cirrosporium novae-zelandiae]